MIKVRGEILRHDTYLYIISISVVFSGNIDPIAGNHYELDNEPADNAYDTVGPNEASGSKSKAPEKDTLPPVYAAVDKNNRQGNTVCEGLKEMSF